MKKKFLFGLIALLSVSFIFFGCGDSGGGGGLGGGDPAAEAAQELGAKLIELFGGAGFEDKVEVVGTEVTLKDTLVIPPSTPNAGVATGVTLTVDTGKTLTTNSDITVNGTIVLTGATFDSGTAGTTVTIGTGATVTGGDNFYAADGIAVTTVAAGAYKWNANADYAGTGGWKAATAAPLGVTDGSQKSGTVVPGVSTGIAELKTVLGAGPQVPGNDASLIYQIPDVDSAPANYIGDIIDAVRDIGGVPVTWDNSEKSGVWATTTKVRADVELLTDNEDDAYLLVWDGTNVYEVIRGGFFAVYTGNEMNNPANGFAKVSSLTFAATAPGTYRFKIDIVEVADVTGAVISTLASQEVTVTVTALPLGIAGESQKTGTVVTDTEADTIAPLKTVTGAGPQVVGNDASLIYQIADVDTAPANNIGDIIDTVRAAGGVPITWDNASEGGVWATDTKVRADVELLTDNEDDAYLLVWDGTNVYEVIRGGFFAVYTGNEMSNPANGFAKVSSLTFAATAAGTYSFRIDIVEVDETDGTVLSTLASQVVTVIVTAAE